MYAVGGFSYERTKHMIKRILDSDKFIQKLNAVYQDSMTELCIMPLGIENWMKHPGCPNLTDGLYCEQHKHLHPDRASAFRRGYGSKWQRVSKAYLRKHPLCVMCLAKGRYVQATVVDHRVPHRGNYELMWSESNWQALCKSCHDRKTGNEDSTPEYRY